jgi:hypothetical protein
MEINLNGMSRIALLELAAKATALANDLRKEEPSYQLALAAGVEDRSYNTVRHGLVSCYTGEGFVRMDNGALWKCIGHGTKGRNGELHSEGYIEFFKIEPAN